MTTQPEPLPDHLTTQPDVTVEQAAQALAVSIPTVRRWIKNGKLKAVKATTTTGFVWRVRLPDDAEASADLTTQMKGIPRFDQAIQAFRTELSSLVEANATQGRRLEELAVENAVLKEQLAQARKSVLRKLWEAIAP